MREFGRDDVEEDLGTIIFVFLGGALWGLEREETHFDETGAVAKKDSFTAYEMGVRVWTWKENARRGSYLL